MTPGKQLQDIILSIDLDEESRDHISNNSDHAIARAAGRFIEEAVELALSCGATPEKIMMHVADALHNEAKKAKCFPSELAPQTDRAERIVELSDVKILHDYLRHISNVSNLEIDQHVKEKIMVIEDASSAGQLVVIDCLMYRKAARL